MPDPNVALLRQAYAAYARGDTAAMPDLVDPAWSGPTSIPAPPTRARRSATAAASCKLHSRSRPQRGLRAQLEEVIGHGDKVVVAVRTPGADIARERHAAGRHRCDVRPHRVPARAVRRVPCRRADCSDGRLASLLSMEARAQSRERILDQVSRPFATRVDLEPDGTLAARAT
jgi:ketosteroid isomerase-like protein